MFLQTTLFKQFIETDNIVPSEIKAINHKISHGINDLNKIFEQFIRTYKVVPSNIKAINHKISRFECTLNGIKYYFVIDSNVNGNHINYKVVKDLCKKNDIEFKNQSFVSVINQLNGQKLIRNLGIQY